MTLVLLLACTATPRWTEEDSVAPHRLRFDADHDGRVSAAEYEAHLWNGPPMGTADRDGDGDLSAEELGFLVYTQTPTTFDGEPEGAEARRAGAGLAGPKGEGESVWEVLVWVNDALRHAGDPGLTPETMAAAVASESFGSPATLAAFAELRPRWEAHGWVWPEGLP